MLLWVSWCHFHSIRVTSVNAVDGVVRCRHLKVFRLFAVLKASFPKVQLLSSQENKNNDSNDNDDDHSNNSTDNDADTVGGLGGSDHPVAGS